MKSNGDGEQQAQLEFKKKQFLLIEPLVIRNIIQLSLQIENTNSEVWVINEDVVDCTAKLYAVDKLLDIIGNRGIYNIVLVLSSTFSNSLLPFAIKCAYKKFNLSIISPDGGNINTSFCKKFDVKHVIVPYPECMVREKLLDAAKRESEEYMDETIIIEDKYIPENFPEYVDFFQAYILEKYGSFLKSDAVSEIWVTTCSGAFSTAMSKAIPEKVNNIVQVGQKKLNFSNFSNVIVRQSDFDFNTLIHPTLLPHCFEVHPKIDSKGWIMFRQFAKKNAVFYNFKTSCDCALNKIYV